MSKEFQVFIPLTVAERAELAAHATARGMTVDELVSALVQEALRRASDQAFEFLGPDSPSRGLNG